MNYVNTQLRMCNYTGLIQLVDDIFHGYSLLTQIKRQYKEDGSNIFDKYLGQIISHFDVDDAVK